MAMARFLNREQWEDSRLMQRMFPGWAQAVTDEAQGAARKPALNLYEDEAAYYARIELPGVKPEYLDVNVDDQVLTLTAALEPLPVAQTLIHGEFSQGDFRRSFKLGRGVDSAGIEAKLQDGILTLTLPKSAEARVHKIPIA